MKPEIAILFECAGINTDHLMNGLTRSEAIQLSIATSLHRIANNLDLVINHNTIPSTSIAVSRSAEHG